MKRFSLPTMILTHTIVIPLILNACGGTQPTPAPNTIDYSATIIAAGSTAIAETMTAVPTSTPQPTATNTILPSPTNTFIPLPTQGPSLTPLPGEGDPCAVATLPAKLDGTTIKIRIDNPTRAAINVSVYLQQTSLRSLCGYRAYSLAAGQSLVINDLTEGCYTIWAWNPDPKNYFMVTNGTSCMNSSRAWAFDITKSSINLKDN